MVILTCKLINWLYQQEKITFTKIIQKIRKWTVKMRQDEKSKRAIDDSEITGNFSQKLLANVLRLKLHGSSFYISVVTNECLQIFTD